MGDKPGLLERLEIGTVLCAEGYVFELERRGYIQAGPYVPEVVLDAPEAVKQLHREFLRAGSDVMLALTKLASNRIGRLLVIEDSKLLGILSQRDIMRLFEFKSEIEGE